MTRTVVVVVLASIVIVAVVGLAIAVRGGPVERAPRTAPTVVPGAAPRAKPTVPRSSGAMGHTKFVSPPGQVARPVDTDPSKRFPIPAGGFAQWTGREGTWPGDIESFAQTAGLPLAVALEQRRSTLLMDRTADTKVLAELLGGPPTGDMLAAIGKHASVLHDTTANFQVQTREQGLGSDASVQRTRAAEDAYRRGYLEATGLSEVQFDGFFAPDRPIP